MEIPHQQLSPEALHGLIEEFVTRDGTDYGDTESSLQQKADQVLSQLENGKIVIIFDPATESFNIVAKHDHRVLHTSLNWNQNEDLNKTEVDND